MAEDELPLVPWNLADEGEVVHGQRLGVTDRTEAALWVQRQARQDGDD